MTTDPYLLIERAESTNDLAAKRAALTEAIVRLPTTAAKPAELAYALGYAWYLMPEHTEERRALTHQHLTEALRLEPNHLYARLYLAHHYFDIDQFALALPLLVEFDAKEFSALGQEWRDVKVAELILCCLLGLRDESRLAGAVGELLSRCSGVDSADIPLPAELTKSLQHLIKAIR